MPYLNHPYVMLSQQKDCIVGSRKWSVLQKFSTVFMLNGGSKKVPHYADVIYEWIIAQWIKQFRLATQFRAKSQFLTNNDIV